MIAGLEGSEKRRVAGRWSMTLPKQRHAHVMGHCLRLFEVACRAMLGKQVYIDGVMGHCFDGATGRSPGRVNNGTIPTFVATGKPFCVYCVMNHLWYPQGCVHWAISIFAALGQTLLIRSLVCPAVLYSTLPLPNRRLSFKAAAACNLAKNRVFLTQVTTPCRGRGSSFALNLVRKAIGVGQIRLDHFSQTIVYTGLISFRQMARGKYTSYTERRGKRFWSEYQGNAQVPQKPDVGVSVSHITQKSTSPPVSIPAMTGGMGKFPDYPEIS